MPVDREHLIYFAYFNSPLYREFILEARKQCKGSCIISAVSVIKLWEDGFLDFAATQWDTRNPPIPTVIDSDTVLVQHFRSLEKLPAVNFLILLDALMASKKKLETNSNNVTIWENPCIEILLHRLKREEWHGMEKLPEIERLLEQKVDDSSILKGVCLCHELWTTRRGYDRED